MSGDNKSEKQYFLQILLCPSAFFELLLINFHFSKSCCLQNHLTVNAFNGKVICS